MFALNDEQLLLRDAAAEATRAILSDSAREDDEGEIFRR